MMFVGSFVEVSDAELSQKVTQSTKDYELQIRSGIAGTAYLRLFTLMFDSKF